MCETPSFLVFEALLLVEWREKELKFNDEGDDGDNVGDGEDSALRCSFEIVQCCGKSVVSQYLSVRASSWSLEAR